MRRRDLLRLGASWLTAAGVALAQRPPTLGQRPPKAALTLFKGSDLSAWISSSGAPPGWRLEARYMEVNPGSGDIMTLQLFTDFQLHLEFWLPDLREALGQARANSGVYLQGRYEIQVLDSFGVEPATDGCGAIYGQAAPLRNASRPPARWQSFDIAFRAARVSAGIVVEKARASVLHNGVLIHNQREIAGPTGGMPDSNEGQPGPLLLQDHGDRVRYRNIWILAG